MKFKDSGVQFQALGGNTMTLKNMPIPSAPRGNEVMVPAGTLVKFTETAPSTSKSNFFISEVEENNGRYCYYLVDWITSEKFWSFVKRSDFSIVRR